MSTNFDQIEAFLTQQADESGQILLKTDLYHEGIALICIDNEKKRNAINAKMMVDLRKIVLELESWTEGKALILYGNGSNFCSGGDLNFARQSGTPEKAKMMSDWMMDTLNRLSNLPLISICLVHGPCLGGGAEISVHCDFILMCENAKYGFVHGKMGIITAWGGGTRLIQKIGKKQALKMLLSSQILSANECRSWGLVDEIIPVENFLQNSIEWLKPYLIHPPNIVQSFKKLGTAAEKSYPTGLLEEKDLTSTLWGADLNRSMLEKRIKHC